MFVGHYSAAFAVKAARQEIPLWVLVFAVQVVDVAWALLVLAGVEKLRVVPGFMAGSDLDLYYMPFTHGLLSNLVWAGAGLVLYRLWRGSGWWTAAWVGAAVLSHWFLDLLVHGKDLPLYDDTCKMGFGLWNHRLLSFALETGLLGAAIWLYLRRVEPGATLRRGTLAFGGVLLAAAAFNTFGPHPDSAVRVVVSALAVFLLATAAIAWVERRAEAPRAA